MSGAAEVLHFERGTAPQVTKAYADKLGVAPLAASSGVPRWAWYAAGGVGVLVLGVVVWRVLR